MNGFGVKEWVELFEKVGLDEAKQHQWHEEFEAAHPDAHESFLAWLGLPKERIRTVRDASAKRHWS